MIFDKVKNEKISDMVIAQLETMIVEGVLGPGDQLPPERELARQLQVSRPSLREAIKDLEKRSLLTSRQGGGTYVTQILGSVFEDTFVQLFQSNAKAISDYVEFRREIDLIACSLAAERATRADKEIIRHIMTRMEECARSDDLAGQIREDVAFHVAIVSASHNVVLLHTMRKIYEQLIPVFYDHIRRPDEQMRETIQSQHEAIYDAIVSGSAMAARQAAETHARFVEDTVRQSRQLGMREETARRRLEILKSSGSDRLIRNGARGIEKPRSKVGE